MEGLLELVAQDGGGALDEALEEGFPRAEPLGEAGADDGEDLVVAAWVWRASRMRLKVALEVVGQGHAASVGGPRVGCLRGFTKAEVARCREMCRACEGLSRSLRWGA